MGLNNNVVINKVKEIQDKCLTTIFTSAEPNEEIDFAEKIAWEFIDLGIYAIRCDDPETIMSVGEERGILGLLEQAIDYCSLPKEKGEELKEIYKEFIQFLVGQKQGQQNEKAPLKTIGNIKKVKLNIPADASVALNLPELGILREHRSDIDRTAKLDLAASILEKLLNNANAISDYDNVYELLFDVCDIINIQPDELKNRNEIFLPQKDDNGDDVVFGWETFDVFGSLMKGNLEDAEVKHRKVREEAIKKFLKDDLQSLLQLVQQIIDIENSIQLARNNKPDETLRMANKRFKGREALLQNIAKLQVEIEDKIRQRQDPKVQQDELKKLIKENALRPRLDNIRHFSQIVNNYYNLIKLEKLCTKIVEYEQASTKEQKRIVLFLLVQIGEFVTNKKITNKIKRLKPVIPWDQLQAIRHLITHQEEKQVYQRLTEFLAGCLESTIPFTQLVAEFKELDKTVKEILVKHYSKPEDTFQTDWKEAQTVRSIRSHSLNFGISEIPESIQRAFLAFITKYKAQSKLPVDEWDKRFKRWQELMGGNPNELARLNNKEEGLLRQLFPPKSADVQRYNVIVVKLSDKNKCRKVLSDEIDFLEQCSRGNADKYRKMVPICSKLKVGDVLSHEEIQLLQTLKPTAACDLDKQECERVIEEIKECVEQKKIYLRKVIRMYLKALPYINKIKKNGLKYYLKIDWLDTKIYNVF